MSAQDRSFGSISVHNPGNLRLWRSRPASDFATRLTRHGALPLDQALAFASQVAEGLDAAHQRGIVHRDLKPGNVVISESGLVKTLDFGLARVTLRAGATADPNSPTITIQRTRAGEIMGTPSYMSPEQVRGEAVDKRTDVWAFGCVLYEMLTGRAAFVGQTITDTLAAIAEREPAWHALPVDLPPAVCRLLRRCLDKDPNRRLRDMGDIRMDVEDATASDVGFASVAEARPQPTTKPARAAVGVVLAAIAAWFGLQYLKPAVPRPVTRLAYSLPEGQSFTNAVRSMVAIAPDGLSMVYVASNQIHRRPMDALEATPIRGTTGDPSTPFFAPD